MLQPGDVILFHRKKFVNWAVRTVTQSYWGHAALYIGNGLYIESIASGVYINTALKLDGKDIAVFRHKEIKAAEKRRIWDKSMGYIESKYDYLAIWHMLWTILKGKRGDGKKLGDEKKYICSELIAKILEEVGLKIRSGYIAEEITPADFEISRNFKRVEIGDLHK